MSSMDVKWLQTPGKLPWRLQPTRKRDPVSAVIYDAEGRLVAACAYGNAELIVRAVNTLGKGDGEHGND